MEQRPKLKLHLSNFDILLEVMGWLILSLIWIYVLIKYTTLPETIPTHYNLSGEADGFGSKFTILTLPLIATFIFIGLTVLNKYPHIFNYPTQITQKNALEQYTIATGMIRVLKLMVVIVFGLIALQTIRNTGSQANSLGSWMLPVTMGMIFLPLIYFIVKMVKTK